MHNNFKNREGIDSIKDRLSKDVLGSRTQKQESFIRLWDGNAFEGWTARLMYLDPDRRSPSSVSSH